MYRSHSLWSTSRIIVNVSVYGRNNYYSIADMVLSIFKIILEYDIVLSYTKIVDTHVILDVE